MKLTPFIFSKHAVAEFLMSFPEQDNVHTNTESVQCISIVYSIYPYEYNQ